MACRAVADLCPAFISSFLGGTRCFHGNSRLVEPYTPTLFHFQNDSIAVNLDNVAVHSSNGHHIVALLHFLDKLPLLFGLLLLGPDHEKVEYENNTAEEQQLRPLTSGLRLQIGRAHV